MRLSVLYQLPRKLAVPSSPVPETSKLSPTGGGLLTPCSRSGLRKCHSGAVGPTEGAQERAGGRLAATL